MTAILERMTQGNHAELGAQITAFRPAVNLLMPGAASGDSSSLALVDMAVTQQALMISYLDDFKLMMYVTIVAMPIVLLLRRPRHQPASAPAAAVSE